MPQYVTRNRRRKILPVALLAAVTSIAAHAQTFTVLVNFTGPNGASPSYESLVQGVDGNFYGTTDHGGPSLLGTVFAMTPQGQVKTLYTFDETGGELPLAGLMVAPDGTLYGTTTWAGDTNSGTIFSITPSGTETTLASFSGTDGAYPWAALIEGFDGMLYGTAIQGGDGGAGVIYQVTPAER